MHGSRFRRVIVNRPNLRIPFPDRFADRLRGKTAVAVSRRGKYLIVELSSGETLIMHLGMSGWFHVAPIGDRSREADPHDHVAFVMSSGPDGALQRSAALWLHGSRRGGHACGTIRR